MNSVNTPEAPVAPDTIAEGTETPGAKEAADVSEIMAEILPDIAKSMGLPAGTTWDTVRQARADQVAETHGYPSGMTMEEIHFRAVKESHGHPEARDRDHLRRLVAIDKAIKNGINPERLDTRSTKQIQRLAHHAFLCVCRGIPITTPKAEITSMVNKGIYPNAE